MASCALGCFEWTLLLILSIIVSHGYIIGIPYFSFLWALRWITHLSCLFIGVPNGYWEERVYRHFSDWPLASPFPAFWLPHHQYLAFHPALFQALLNVSFFDSSHVTFYFIFWFIFWTIPSVIPMGLSLRWRWHSPPSIQSAVWGPSFVVPRVFGSKTSHSPLYVKAVYFDSCENDLLHITTWHSLPVPLVCFVVAVCCTFQNKGGLYCFRSRRFCFSLNHFRPRSISSLTHCFASVQKTIYSDRRVRTVLLLFVFFWATTHWRQPGSFSPDDTDHASRSLMLNYSPRIKFWLSLFCKSGASPCP